MPIQSREEFMEYCLRKLGAPVIRINVDVDQVQDRIDEALAYYIKYHYDGTERDIVRVVADAEMVAKRAIKVDKDVVSVLQVVPTITEFEAALAGAPSSRAADGSISLNYFYGANQGGFSMRSYASYRVHSDVIRWMFRPENNITFRMANHTITFDETVPIALGDVFNVQVYRGIDPETHETVWQDLWLQEFATCLIKQQWGSNLSKFSGVQLPTGITLDGQKIYDDASAEREKLIERLRNEFEYPTDFFMG